METALQNTKKELDIPDRNLFEKILCKSWKKEKKIFGRHDKNYTGFSYVDIGTWISTEYMIEDYSDKIMVKRMDDIPAHIIQEAKEPHFTGITSLEDFNYYQVKIQGVVKFGESMPFYLYFDCSDNIYKIFDPNQRKIIIEKWTQC